MSEGESAEGTKPLCIELYCGTFGWSLGWLALGGRSVGFDIEHCEHHGPVPEGASLVIQDVTTLHGSQFRNASLILASPPCTEYSYMAMPWKRAKQIEKALCGHGEFPEGYTGSRTVAELNRLFDACFRIQKEACEAAGRYIPMVVENVRGAQKWVGKSKANFGSYYLWGDVGMVGKRVVAGVPRFGVSVQPMRSGGQKSPPGNASSPLWKDREISRTGAHATPEEAAALEAWVEERDGQKVPGFRFDGSGRSFQTASVEAQKRNPDGTDHPSGSWFKIADSKNRGAQAQNTAKLYADRDTQGTKQHGSGHIWYRTGNGAMSSKSDSRKAASAQIAKIPFPLAQHIARVFL